MFSQVLFSHCHTNVQAQVVKRRLVVSEVEAAEGGEEGDAQVEVLGEGTVLQRVFTLQARPSARARLDFWGGPLTPFPETSLGVVRGGAAVLQHMFHDARAFLITRGPRHCGMCACY